MFFIVFYVRILNLFVFTHLYLPIHSKKINDNAEDDAPVLIKGDSWFGSVKAAAEIAERGMQCCMQVKTSTSLYPKKYIEEALKGNPGGVHIVLRGKHPNGNILVAVGYRYSSKKTLFFIMTDGAGPTTPGRPYEMKFTDEYGNVGKFLLCFVLHVYYLLRFTI